MSYNPHNVLLHGKISVINQVFEDMNVWYMAKPCQMDDMGQSITDRRVEWQMDTIRISVSVSSFFKWQSAKSLSNYTSVHFALSMQVFVSFITSGSTKDTNRWLIIPYLRPFRTVLSPLCLCVENFVNRSRIMAHIRYPIITQFKNTVVTREFAICMLYATATWKSLHCD